MTGLGPGRRWLRTAADQARRQATLVSTLARAGVLRPHHPGHLAVAGRRVLDYGIGFAGGIAATASLQPDAVFVVDDRGSLTWAEVDDRAIRLANALTALGVGPGDAVALLCRNHRHFVEASTALSRLGADQVYLNTAFAGPQLGDVCRREGVAAVIYDEEFAGMVGSADVGDARRVLAWQDRPAAQSATESAAQFSAESSAESAGVPDGVDATVEQLIGSGSTTAPAKPERASRPIILTSGTTGSPKGAPRGDTGLDGAVALLQMPFHHGGRTHIAAPMFHTWGWAHLNLAMLLGSTVVLRRRFDPADCLRAIVDERCDAMIAIPVMLQRMLALPPEQRSGDYSRLRVVAASGSALPGDLATEWMDAFGDNLYNTYGSTEIAWATIASPRDLREAPGTAGRPPPNTVVRLYDDADRPSPEGEVGRIFVGNSMLFGGYTGDAGTKRAIDGLMASGDVGRFDEAGRLFVEGRDDDMIVSGGENVFPAEVEDCMARHADVVEVAAIGVDDPDYGQRLRAFVVRATDSDVDEDALRDWVKQHLARYKVPREVVFVDELPRNATGKVLKRELRQ